MTTPLTTTLPVELTLTIRGEYQEYVPPRGPSYSSGGEPAEGGFCEDLSIDGISISVSVGSIDGKRKYTDVNLLDGIDTSTVSMQAFLANLLRAIHDDAQDALAEELPEGPDPDEREEYDDPRDYPEDF